MDPTRFYTNNNFSADDHCVFVVYPAGTAGDLLASIINWHYIETGSKFLGIDHTGRVIFKPSDNKFINGLQYKKDLSSVVEAVNHSRTQRSLNNSMCDQTIFACHWHGQKPLQAISQYFTNAKIVRIYIENSQQQALTTWMTEYKNTGKIHDFSVTELDLNNTKIQQSQDNLLQISFGNLLHKDKFTVELERLVNFLDLPCALIDYNVIDYWISKQHAHIKPMLRAMQ
jgi:hypothetical protein